MGRDVTFPVNKSSTSGKGKREDVVIYLSLGMGLLSFGIGHLKLVSLIGNLSLGISKSLLALKESPGHPFLLSVGSSRAWSLPYAMSRAWSQPGHPLYKVSASITRK